MKKVGLIFCFLITIFVFYSCGKIDVNKLCFEKISEERVNFYFEEKDDLVLTFSSGYREKDYALNGEYSGESVEFGLLTLYSKSHAHFEQNGSSYYLTIGKDVFEGNFEKNPFDGSLVADLNKFINEDKFDVKLKVDNFEYSFSLNNVSKEWKVSSKDALEFASTATMQTLKKSCKNGKFDGEVYVKVAYNFSIDNNCDWFIKFLTKDFGTISVIIDKENGNIISIYNE